jgi:regulatory protein
MIRKKKILDEGVIMQKIRIFCSYQERCIRETEGKLHDWAVQKKLIPGIIQKLEEEGFLNEERFAKAFAGGKFRMNKWGKHRIEFELRFRGILDEYIRKGIAEIDENDYLNTLHDLIEKKYREIKPQKDLNVREKIITFAQGKGFETDLILSIVKELNI